MSPERGAAPRASHDNGTPKARLVSTDSGNPREYAVDGATITVGSHRNNNIVLGEGTVSRRHAQFTREATHFNLADLHSTNGTFVNGRRIQSPVALQTGDEIRFGSVKFTFTTVAGGSQIVVRRPVRFRTVVATFVGIFLVTLVGHFYRDEIVSLASSLLSKTSQPEAIVPSSAPTTATENSAAAISPAPEMSPLPLTDQPPWLARLNYYRGMLRLVPVADDPKLSASDRAHAMYIVKNYPAQIQNGGLGPEMHQEDSGNRWFTAAGREAAKASDIEAWFMRGDLRDNDPTGAADPSEWAKERAPGTEGWTIDGWMAIPFHRMPMLNPRLVRAGFGQYCEEGACAAGLDLKDGTVRGIPKFEIKWPLEFPPDGSTIGMESFGQEWPDPRSSCSGYETPSGLAITMQMGADQESHLGDFSLSQVEAGGGRTRLEACGFDSQSYANPDPSVERLAREILVNYGAVVVIPRRPLVKGGKYDVSITADGQPYKWTFSIAP